MMGEQLGRQDRLFYEFCLEDRVPADHLLRRIDAVLELSWLRCELAPHYSHTGCPSVDPEPMIGMLPIGYCYSIRRAMLGAAVVRETERRKAAIVLEANRETDAGKDWVLFHRPRPGADQVARRIARRIDISGRRFLPSVQTGRNKSYPRSEG